MGAIKLLVVDLIIVAAVALVAIFVLPRAVVGERQRRVDGLLGKPWDLLLPINIHGSGRPTRLCDSVSHT